MATNATVEKLQAVAIRHGEKAVVGLAVILFGFFAFKAITREPAIGFGPDALQKKAESADSNLSQKQNPEQILAKLVDQGLKPETQFEATVVGQQARALNPADFVVRNKWVTPEPGAGLIRDQPDLIAPEDLYAFPNRGGYQLFAINEKGDRIEDTGKDAKKKPTRWGAPPRRRGGMMGQMGSPMGGRRSGGSSKLARAEAEAKRLAEEEIRLRGLAGSKDEAKPSEKSAAQPTAAVAYKEVVKGLRSVVITGTLDNKKLKENYLNALKSPALAFPNYKRLDVQRQALGADGEWSAFEDVDDDANLDVLDNLTEVEDELVPKDALLEALVDPLPFAKAGYWIGVHVASLVPREKLEVKRPALGAGPGMSGMNSEYMAAMMAGQSKMAGSSGGMSPAGAMASSMSSMMKGSPNMMGRMPGAAPGNAATGPVDETDFEKSEADEVMIRSIDFTAQPDATYRYQVRIVVVNPNRYRTDVNPGVDTESEELKGPWSEPTDPVAVPADVATYAMNKAPATRRDDQVIFQIVRWNPADGHTVTRNDEAGPGELIGQHASAQVPSSEGKGTTPTPIDFNSHQLVVDTMGGPQPAAKAIGATAPFDEPALSLVLRPDGAVALRAQPRDVTDSVRIEMENIYKRALKNSAKKRQPRGPGGMMGSPMGGRR